MAADSMKEMNDSLESLADSVPAAHAYGQNRIVLAALVALCASSANPERVKAEILNALSSLEAEPMEKAGSSYGSHKPYVLEAATLTAETLVAACDRAEGRTPFTAVD